LQPEALIHQPLQARAVENIVGKVSVGKNAQSRGGHLRPSGFY